MSMSSAFLQDFHLRPTAMDDLESVLELVNACYRADYDQHWSVTEGFLRNTWQAPAIHLETDSWVVISKKSHRGMTVIFKSHERLQQRSISGMLIIGTLQQSVFW